MKNLLIVEDERLIRQGIRVIIEDSPLCIGQIFECKNGEEAWELLQKEDIEAVLTDIKMPKMDGISLVQKINTLDKKPHTVVISGYDDFSFAVEMMRNGTLDYILKPIDRNRLVEILEKIDGILDKEQKKQEEERMALAYFKSMGDTDQPADSVSEWNRESQNQQKMYEAVRYIKENYSKPLNMAVVSNHVSMNYTLFSNSFKQFTGVNFVIYLKDLRIEKAKYLLKTTDKKIKEISSIVGYEDDKRFLKVFKQSCGISPKEYRKGIIN